MSDQDKDYLSSEMASRMGISKDDANKHLDEAVAALNAATEKAKQAAETARKTGILVAFLIAASLAVSAAAAWWAASIGGKHRDGGMDLSHFTVWR